MGTYATIKEMVKKIKETQKQIDIDLSGYTHSEIYAGRYFIAGTDINSENGTGNFLIYSCSDKGKVERMPVGKFYHLQYAEEMAKWISEPGPWKYISQIIRANMEAGYYFFSEKTIKAFHSKIYEEVYGGRFIITSEKNGSNPRGYAVRSVSDDGTNINKLEEWYDSIDQARRVARLITKEIE